MISPLIRNNICINCHPQGCEQGVMNQIGYVKKQRTPAIPGADTERHGAGGIPRLVLVIGCSTGYGLASRIAAAFEFGAATVGISLEKPPGGSSTGTPGWYNNRRFDAEAAREGLAAATLNGDAFSDAMKAEAIRTLRETAAAAGLPPLVDLVIYSLASPVRLDPLDGVLYRSVIKPTGAPFAGKTIDMFSGKIRHTQVEPASPEEIAHTVKVMGGEDWERWMDALDDAGVLAPAARTLAYTYLGPELSWPIYKNGTIGRAKEDLERAGRRINEKFAAQGAQSARGLKRRAWVSVNKALVTRASAVIPIIPFYVSCLFKVMKKKGLHEGCIEQILRLYRERLYTPKGAADPEKVPVDGEGRIRMDDWEMGEEVQRETAELMAGVTEENVFTATDIGGVKHDFLEAHGFDVAGINYEGGGGGTDGAAR